MFDAPLRPLIDRLTNPVGQWLAARNVPASLVTIVGFGFGVAAALAIIWGAMGWALLLVLLNRLCDGLDGAIARAVGATDFGGFLDIFLDFMFYALIPLAFAVYDPANAQAAAFLIFSFFGTGSSFLAFAIMAEKRGISDSRRGRKSFYYLGGLTEGTETIILFLVIILVPEWFVLAAYGFGLLCWLTTGFRVYEAYSMLTR